MQRFEQLLAEVGQEVGVDLKGTQGPIEFDFGGFPVTIASDDRSGQEDVVLSAQLGTVPAARELEVYRLLLEANVFWSGTADATLGVNSATREAILCYRRPAEGLAGKDMAGLLGAFVQIAENWRNFIVAANEATAHADGGASPESMIRV